MDNVNTVHLVGRLSSEPIWRKTRAGGWLAAFHVTVRRPPDPDTGKAPTDAIRCVAFDELPQGALRDRAVGEEVEVHGRIRRSVWRPHGRLAISYQVEVTEIGAVRSAG